MRGVPAGAVDAVLAAVALVSILVEAAFAEASIGARLAALAPGALVAGALLVRRRRPLAAVATGAAALIVTNLLERDVYDQLNTPYFAFLFLVYAMAARESRRRVLVGVGISLATIVVVTLTLDRRLEDTSLAGQLLVGIGFFVVAPVFAGRLLHSRLRLNHALEAKAGRAAAARDERAAEAAAAERTRIAGELHDLVAHALGAMTVQASAARRFADRDAARAETALAAVEQTGRDALGELRTLLEVLRDDDAEPLHGPQPTLAQLGALADRAGAAGLGVTVTVEGARPAGLPAGVDLTAYRVVQDALRAARGDGGAGAASVTVRYLHDRVEVEVSDDGPGGSERKLLGLRERVRLYGGEVSVRAAAGGGHVVRARLPLNPVPA